MWVLPYCNPDGAPTAYFMGLSKIRNTAQISSVRRPKFKWLYQPANCSNVIRRGQEFKRDFLRYRLLLVDINTLKRSGREFTSASMQFLTSVLLLWLSALSFVFAFSQEDSCCKACSAIGDGPFNPDVCPPTDIFCGCDVVIARSPICRACVDASFAHGIPTEYGSIMSPMEYFFSWCQCQRDCRPVAEAIFGTACSTPQCTLSTLVKEGPKCSHCVTKIDAWFGGAMDVWIEEAKKQLQSGQYSFTPGIFPNFSIYI